MKSFEFLISVAIIMAIFAPLYTIAKNEADSLNSKLKEFNESIRYQTTTSIIDNMRAYGAPFSYEGFGEFNPSKTDKASYNPLTDKFTYSTYSRW